MGFQLSMDEVGLSELMFLFCLFDEQVTPELPIKGMLILPSLNVPHVVSNDFILCEAIQLT